MHVRGVDGDVLTAHVAGFEGELVEEALENGVETASTDVLCPLVDLSGVAGDLGDRIVGEAEGNAFGGEQLGVLHGQSVLRLAKNADEIGLSQRLELDTNRK